MPAPTMTATRSASLLRLAFFAAFTAAACGDDTGIREQPDTRADAGPTRAEDDQAEASDEPDDGDEAKPRPLYAMMIQVYGDEDRSVYVYLSDGLNLPSELDLSSAREFPGVANFAAVGGRLLISSGVAPDITSYRISDDKQWTLEDTISFAAYSLSDNANFYSQYILSDHVAYLPYDITKRLIWDPTAMTITETREDSEIALEKDGLLADVGGNRNGIRFDGPVQQAFYYTDKDYFEFGPESIVAIYDEKTHEERERLSLPCPGLSMPSQDEQGYTYYGTWSFQGKRALFGEGPKPCFARLTPDRKLDEAWTTDLRDLTGGRYVNNLRYIGKGRAIGNVLHHDLIDLDWKAGFSDAADDEIDESDAWRLWLFDLKNEEAHEVEGIDVSITGGAQFAVLDGRTFVFLPYEEWRRTKIYELDERGAAIVRADTIGDVFKWIRVR
jgi:hypothetical protein